MNRYRWFSTALLAPILLIAVPVLAMAAGTDEQAAGLVRTLAPDYQPWVSPLFGVPEGRVENLLFALQAALGFGVIVYCFTAMRRRARIRKGGGAC
jgi:cobalt/nickel transport protein